MTDAMPRPSHAAACAAFDFGAAMAELAGNAAAGFNAAEECCDRHCGSDAIALRAIDMAGRHQAYRFEDLQDRSARVAALLRDLGIGRGDRVAGLLPRTADLVTLILGVWRVGAVYQPLFTAFGPKAIEHRLLAAQTALVVTDATNRAKLEGLDLPDLRIATVDAPCRDGDMDLGGEIAMRAPDTTLARLSADDPFLLMFTSGTTGPAKRLYVPVRALAAFRAYLRDAVGLREDDRFWNIADPGWAYGLYYAVAGPLALGHATILSAAPFTADTCVDTIARHGITNLAGSPTAFRLLTTVGDDRLDTIAGQLRSVSSAGEPLDPGLIRWFAQRLGVTIHDHYGQTELGMVVCNHHALDHAVTPGSAGFAVPGHRVAVVDDVDEECAPGVPGVLAIDRAASPLFWFGGYEDAPPPSGRYYRSGDTVERQADGSIAFVGRADDVITSSGYRIGPFDVESALTEHPAVLEAAVIGKPDPRRTEIVKAFVVLREGHAADPGLEEALRQLVRQRLSAHSYPREIAFVDALPKTPSGKIQRFMLRAGEKQAARSSR